MIFFSFNNLDTDQAQRFVSLDPDSNYGPPGVLGIWGEWLFIFRELGSTGNYFRELGSKFIVLGI